MAEKEFGKESFSFENISKTNVYQLTSTTPNFKSLYVPLLVLFNFYEWQKYGVYLESRNTQNIHFYLQY